MNEPAPHPTLTRQATCVAIDGRGVLIEGPPGIGKSSLALALIDRGAVLVGDDGVAIETCDGKLFASPHPQTRGLLEVRNLGLLPFREYGAVTVALLLRLTPDAPRYIETAKTELIAGAAVPRIDLWPETPVLALRAEWALAHYGLPGSECPFVARLRKITECRPLFFSLLQAHRIKPMVAPSTRTPFVAPKQRVLLVTGVLGAGKTTALRAFEDLGWETIDNFPIRLLERLIDNPDLPADVDTTLVIGFDSRTRGFNAHTVIEIVKKLTGRDDLMLSTLFLDCAGEELERRYNETRRRHPLAADMPASSGIAAERELMEPLRRWADMVITTTAFSAHQLQQAIREQFAPESGPGMTITVSSFGFARGMPPVADFVFDMRFVDNPHWDPVLRPLTGKDPTIGEFIRRDPAFDDSFARIRDLLLAVLPRFKAQGKAYVHIAFGCTGGRHRSVFTAEQMAAALREAGFSPTLIHRNLGSRAADLVEGGTAR